MKNAHLLSNGCFLSYMMLVMLCSCKFNGPVTLSGNSSYRQKSIFSENILLHRTTIYPDVTEYVYNADFIIAKQKPERSAFTTRLAMDLYTRYTAYAAFKADPDIFKKPSWRGLKEKVACDSVNYKMFSALGASDRNTHADIQIRARIADSLVKNDPYYRKIFSNNENYWIVYNPGDTLIGPLTKEEYFVKRKELRIPDDLQLE